MGAGGRRQPAAVGRSPLKPASVPCIPGSEFLCGLCAKHGSTGALQGQTKLGSALVAATIGEVLVNKTRREQSMGVSEHNLAVSAVWRFRCPLKPTSAAHAEAGNTRCSHQTVRPGTYGLVGYIKCARSRCPRRRLCVRCRRTAGVDSQVPSPNALRARAWVSLPPRASTAAWCACAGGPTARSARPTARVCPHGACPLHAHHHFAVGLPPRSLRVCAAPAMVLVLLLAAAAARGASAFTWEACDGGVAPWKVSDVALSPDPPVIGSSVTFTIKTDAGVFCLHAAMR